MGRLVRSMDVERVSLGFARFHLDLLSVQCRHSERSSISTEVGRQVQDLGLGPILS